MTSILGISAFYHDSAAALINDGKIIAAFQEETFSRKKNDFRYPFYSVEYVLKKAKLKLNTHFLGGYKKGKDGIRRIKTTYSGQVALNENELRSSFERAAKQLEMEFNPKIIVFTEGFDSECSIIRRTYNKTNVEFFEGIEQGKEIVLGKTLQKGGARKRFRHAPHRQIAYGDQFRVSVLPAPTSCRAQCQK